ncbi:MAG: sigma-70 family RNA polymerase sigma factor [Candidatus Eisenbacteria bacterium]|uniref:Sigma-70 family RNA polymerase sigma factor n=1 Tax=Eiseniibacteriota bacterium TaxID=2212470 RepID=A0A849SLX1_UNCEI|nr:sigma-70 family RNA polymerase sigma factor [Candidatus Eisenbacteria bacterium]
MPADDAVAAESVGADVRASQRGDRRAFERLYARYGRMVHGIVIARAPRTETEDLVQEVFIQAWTRIGTLREPDAFGGWLAQLARHRSTDALRRGRAPEPLDPELAAPDSHHAEAIRVLALIRALPEAYRETLALRLIEGLTGPEIAAMTGMQPGSVRVNLHRGMTLLRERLGVDGAQRMPGAAGGSS